MKATFVDEGKKKVVKDGEQERKEKVKKKEEENSMKNGKLRRK